jgi:3-deoxy-D-manno-octulosonic-acid transferase
MILIYNILIQLYLFAIRIVAFWGNIKAKKWIQGRKEINNQIKDFNLENKQVIWFHCASLGEFEQGRPLVENVKLQYPDYKILLTFFSPSGYEIRKEYPFADVVTYLPFDTKAAVADFIAKIKPKIVIIVKYEFWYHLLQTLSSKNIPIILISSIFDKKQIFFKSYGLFFKRMLFQFDRIFVQNLHSFELLKNIGLSNIDIAGDTRVDRVLAITEEKFHDPKVESFLDKRPVIICGSTWQKDEEIIIEAINSQKIDAQWIIIPHEIDAENNLKIADKINLKTCIYSNIDNYQNCSVMIIDKIGLLAFIYRYATITYIGGGFGKGIHNTLEAIAYGKPVIFGPNYSKFYEAVSMIETKSAISISDTASFIKAIHFFKIANKYQKAQLSNLDYIENNKGATEKILFYIDKLIKN